MRSKAMGLLLLVLLLVLFLFAPLSFAVKSEAGDESQETGPKIEDEKKQLSKLTKEEEKIVKELVALETSLENTNDNLKSLEERLAVTKRKVNAIQLMLDETQLDLDARIGRLNKRVIQIYKQGEASYISVVLFSDNLPDFITRVDFLNLIVEQDARLIRKIEGNKKRLDNLGEGLELRYAQQLKLKEDKEETKEVIEEKAQQKQQYLEQIKREKKLSEDKIASLQKEAQNVREAMKRFGTSEVIPEGTTMRVKATGYAGNCDLCGSHGITSTGLKAEYGIAAVSRYPNKRVVPLGTKIYVEGYGEALVADVGGGVKENQIDLAFETHQEAMNWGVKWVTITILE